MSESPKVPNPGSDAARSLGCLCPVLDNAHGKGCDGMFWVQRNCPLHGDDKANYSPLSVERRESR